MVVLVAVVVLAAVLRSFHLTARSLWFDEAWSVSLARMPLGQLLATLRGADAHPPLYFLLLRAWVDWFGDGETPVRVLSVVVGSATVGLAYVAAWRWAGRMVAAVAAFLLAVSPFHVMASQEARMYPLLGLLVLAATAALWEALYRSGSWWVAYGLLGAASLYTHYLAGPVVLAHGLYVFAVDRRRESCLRWMATVAGMVALFSPWLPTFVHQLTGGAGWPQWRPPLSLRTLADLLALMAFGGYLLGTGTYHWSGDAALGWYVPLLLPVVLLTVAGLSWTALPRPLRLYLLVVLVVPVAVPVVVSLRWNVVYARYFSFLVPLATVAAACGVVRVGTALWRHGPATVVVLGGLLAYQGPVLVDYYTSPRLRLYDWRTAAALVARDGRPGDLVLVVPGEGRVAFDYYYHGPLRRVGLTPVEYRERQRQSAGPEGDPTTFGTRHVEALARHYPRLWLVLTLPEPPGARRRLTRLLEPSYVPVTGYDFTGVQVFLWERRSPPEGGTRPAR
jgi:4-amino-4-deoxy-L-arabinose transferase-like glycosyltransferase